MTDNWTPLQRQPMRKSKRMRSIRAVLSPVYFERLLGEARLRGVTSEVLIRQLLEHILRDELIEAVIDGEPLVDSASSRRSPSAAARSV